jgi:predicted small secreted protein
LAPVTESIAQITVDNTNVYWVLQGVDGSKIQMMPKEGEVVTTITTSTNLINYLLVRGAYAIWLEYLGSNTYNINRTTIADGTTVNLKVFNSINVQHLASDGTYIYWLNAEYRTTVNTTAVYAIPIMGGATTTVYSGTTWGVQFVAQGDQQAMCYAVGTYVATSIYYPVSLFCSSIVNGVNKTTNVVSSAKTTASGEGTHGPMVYTGGHMFFRNEMGIATEDKYSITLSNHLEFLLGSYNWVDLMTGDGAHLFFGSYANTGNPIYEIPVNGTEAIAITPNTSSYSMASDGNYIYWTDSTYIRRAPKL